MTRVIELVEVTKTYPGGVAALRGVSLTIDHGELVAIVGPSGSGKSTMLHLIGTLDRPSTGTVRVEGHDVTTLSDRQLSALRTPGLDSRCAWTPTGRVRIEIWGRLCHVTPCAWRISWRASGCGSLVRAASAVATSCMPAFT